MNVANAVYIDGVISPTVRVDFLGKHSIEPLVRDLVTRLSAKFGWNLNYNFCPRIRIKPGLSILPEGYLITRDDQLGSVAVVTAAPEADVAERAYVSAHFPLPFDRQGFLKDYAESLNAQREAGQ